MQIEWFACRWLIPTLIAAGLMLGSAPAWAADVAWRNTTPGSSPTAPDGSYSFEGTSNFAGEEVKIAVSGLLRSPCPNR